MSHRENFRGDRPLQPRTQASQPQDEQTVKREDLSCIFWCHCGALSKLQRTKKTVENPSQFDRGVYDQIFQAVYVLCDWWPEDTWQNWHQFFFWSKRSDLFFGSEYTEDQYEEKDEATHAMIYDTTQCICHVYSFKCILMYLYMWR